MAPFLALMGSPDVDKLTTEQAYKLREMCLLDFKQRLINMAELIHARFEKVAVSHSINSTHHSCKLRPRTFTPRTTPQ